MGESACWLHLTCRACGTVADDLDADGHCPACRAPAGSDTTTTTSTDPGSDHMDGDILDVRPMPPAQRHETIISTFEDLDVDEAFVLVNDHDPKPLRYQFAAEYTDQFSWKYLRTGPEVWEVRIGRRAPA